MVYSIKVFKAFKQKREHKNYRDKNILVIRRFIGFLCRYLSECMCYVVIILHCIQTKHEEACKKERKTRDVLVLCKSAGEPLFKMRWDGL